MQQQQQQQQQWQQRQQQQATTLATWWLCIVPLLGSMLRFKQLYEASLRRNLHNIEVWVKTSGRC
jgi:hypothetical protein